MFDVINAVSAVTAPDVAVLFLIVLVVNAAVVLVPEIIAEFAVNDEAPVPPLATPSVPDVMFPAAWLCELAAAPTSE